MTARWQVRSQRAVDWLEDAATTAAALIQFVIMLVVVLDVSMRYLFNAPLTWSYDLISLYLMIALFYFALSYAYRDGFHVNVDIVYRRFGPRTRRFCDFVVGLLALGLFTGMLAVGAAKTWQGFVNDEVMTGTIAWPTWIPGVFLVLGCVLLLLRILLRAILGMHAPHAARAPVEWPSR